MYKFTYRCKVGNIQYQILVMRAPTTKRLYVYMYLMFCLQFDALQIDVLSAI